MQSITVQHHIGPFVVTRRAASTFHVQRPSKDVLDNQGQPLLSDRFIITLNEQRNGHWTWSAWDMQRSRPISDRLPASLADFAATICQHRNKQIVK